VLVKPAGPDCNMACTYCFYLEKSELFSETNKHRMSEKILEEMVKQVMGQAGREVSFGWQGGEPTLMGVPFFEKAVSFQERYGRGQTVGNGLQTNGILIDEKWAQFLKEYKFLVGLSLDGPAHIHNRYRFFRNGKGSWSKVVDSAHRMLDTGVEVNALTVLNDYSVQFPEEIYNFHKSLGLSFMQFIPCVEPDPKSPKKAAPFSVSAKAYGEFLCKVFDLWRADFKDNLPITSIRFFDSVFHLYVGLSAPECTLLHECGIYVVIEHNGDIYSCDFFVEPKWKLGNILKGSLSDMLNSDRQIEFGRIKASFPGECEKCKWLNYCWGGCTKDRIKDPRDKGLNHFCAAYKMFFDHADSEMRKIADDWMRRQAMERSRQQFDLLASQGMNQPSGRNDPCPCGSGKKYKLCCEGKSE